MKSTLLDRVISFLPTLRRRSAVSEIRCPGCKTITKFSMGAATSPAPMVSIRGLATCDHIWPEMNLNEKNKRALWGVNVWPITILSDGGGVVEEAATKLPVAESKRLINVPPGLVQDVGEAERAHYFFGYKAAAVMCRRAIQLALEDKLGLQSERLTLGPLLIKEEGHAPRLFSNLEHALATRIKDLGDDGAHHEVTLEPSDVSTVIYDTVKLLNKLYQEKPASPSETSSNAP